MVQSSNQMPGEIFPGIFLAELPEWASFNKVLLGEIQSRPIGILFLAFLSDTLFSYLLCGSCLYPPAFGRDYS